MSGSTSVIVQSNFWTELYMGQNPRASCLSSAVDVVFEEGKGWHVGMTTGSIIAHILCPIKIPAGALLINEEPYAYCVYDQCASFFCQHCLKPLTVDGNVPCDKCSDPLVVFCNVDCRDTAWLAYHKYECGPVRQLLQCVGIKLHSLLLALRILVRTPIKDLILAHSKLDKPDSKYGTSETDQFNDLSGQFTAIMSLLADEDFQVLPEIINAPPTVRPKTGLSKLCSFIVDQLKTGSAFLFTNNNWPSEIEFEERVKMVGTMLLAILKRLSRNRQGILEHCKMSRNDIKEVFEQLDNHKATAVYPTAALLNHGCLPNIHMIFQDRAAMQARSISPINPGEPLVHCYGPKFGKDLKVERQELLRHDYLFDCACKACISEEYEQIEREMNVIRCVKCSGEIPIDAELCQSCKADSNLQRKELQETFDIFNKKISSSPDYAKSDAVRDQLLDEWKLLEARCHNQHKQINELRGKLGALLVVSGWSTFAEPLLVCHVATTKRHTGPLSLRTALALSRLCCAYREHSTEKYWLSAALMIRIHLNHFGTKHVRMMFQQNGLLHFLPALDMIEKGVV